MTFLIRWLAFGLALTLLSHSASAQDFSARPIRIIVGLVAGGATDVTARLVAQKLGEKLHTNVYVDNRPGGIFIPATRELIGAAADGHTLLMISICIPPIGVCAHPPRSSGICCYLIEIT